MWCAFLTINPVFNSTYCISWDRKDSTHDRFRTNTQNKSLKNGNNPGFVETFIPIFKLQFQMNFQLLNINIPEVLVILNYVFHRVHQIGTSLLWACICGLKLRCFVLEAIIGLLFLRTKFSSDLLKVTQEVHSKTESQSIFNSWDDPCIWLDLEP